MRIKGLIKFTVFGFVLFSCTDIPSEEILIRDYIINSEGGNAKTDLIINSIKKVGEVIASDSLELFCLDFNKNTSKKDPLSTDHILSTCNETIITYSNLIEELTIKVDSLKKLVGEINETEKDVNQIYDDLKTYSEYDLYTKSLQRCRDLKDKYQHLHTRLDLYKTNGDSLLAIKYQCLYTVDTNISDTIPSKSQTFLINPEGNKILAVFNE